MKAKCIMLSSITGLKAVMLLSFLVSLQLAFS